MIFFLSSCLPSVLLFNDNIINRLSGTFEKIYIVFLRAIHLKEKGNNDLKRLI